MSGFRPQRLPLADARSCAESRAYRIHSEWQRSARVGVGERGLSPEKAHARHGERQAQQGDRSRYGEHGDGVLYTRHGTKLHQDPPIGWGDPPRTIAEAGYRTITRATTTSETSKQRFQASATSACSAGSVLARRLRLGRLLEVEVGDVELSGRLQARPILNDDAPPFRRCDEPVAP